VGVTPARVARLARKTRCRPRRRRRSAAGFKVGDKAVYPAQGVAEVVNIEEKDIAGSRQRFYVLRILDTDRKIMVPVSNASASG
jgi:CarD family transcriptional regulator